MVLGNTERVVCEDTWHIASHTGVLNIIIHNFQIIYIYIYIRVYDVYVYVCVSGGSVHVRLVS